MKFDKAEIARRQLGAALQLFLDDHDPVSVHALSAGGMEIAQALAQRAGKATFRSVAVDANPELSDRLYEKIKNQWWNAFKHSEDRKGMPRDDTELLKDFDDEANEMMLLIGWLDLATVTGRMPIEAQCFQAWYFAVHREQLGPEAQMPSVDRYFPGIRSKGRRDQKRDLVKAIPKLRRLKELMESPQTERRKLLLPNNLEDFSR